MNKKYFLTFGAITATVSPIVAVVSCGDEKTTSPGDSPQKSLEDIVKMFENKKLTKTYAINAQVNYATTALTWEKMQEKLDAWCGENPIDLGDKQDGIEFNFKVAQKIDYGSSDEEITIKIIKGNEEKEVTIKVDTAADKGVADNQAIKLIADQFDSLTVNNIAESVGTINVTGLQVLDEAKWDQLTKSGTMSKPFNFPKRLFETKLKYSVASSIIPGTTGKIKVQISKGGKTVEKDVDLNILVNTQNGAITLKSNQTLASSGQGAALDSTNAKKYNITIQGTNYFNKDDVKNLFAGKGTLIVEYIKDTTGAAPANANYFDVAPSAAMTTGIYEFTITDPGLGSANPTPDVVTLVVTVG